MRIGMLWFDDNSQRDLAAKLELATRHYEAKYGIHPTVCYVHPSMLLKRSTSVPGLEVRTSNNVLPHHFWLGFEQPGEAQQRPAA